MPHALFGATPLTKSLQSLMDSPPTLVMRYRSTLCGPTDAGDLSMWSTRQWTTYRGLLSRTITPRTATTTPANAMIDCQLNSFSRIESVLILRPVHFWARMERLITQIE